MKRLTGPVLCVLAVGWLYSIWHVVHHEARIEALEGAIEDMRLADQMDVRLARPAISEAFAMAIIEDAGARLGHGLILGTRRGCRSQH